MSAKGLNRMQMVRLLSTLYAVCHRMLYIFANPTSVSVHMSRAGLTSSQPVSSCVHKASIIQSYAAVLFEELSFYIANFEWVSGNAVLGFENV